MAPKRSDKQDKLVRFLERRAWRPVLKAPEDEYRDSDQKRLERVKRKTEAQQERYRSYKSAGQVRQEFEDDLSSRAAKRVNADLRKLELPTQPDVADEFFHLADRLGVTAGRGERQHHRPHAPRKRSR